MSPVTYQFALPAQQTIFPVFHVDLLTPCCETPMHGHNYLHPPPDLVNGEEEYEVEHILGSRWHGSGHKLQYLVKWVWYPNSENQWVDKKDLHTDQVLVEFRGQNLEQPTHIRRTWVESESSAPHTPIAADAPITTVMATQEMCCKLVTAELTEALWHFHDWTPAYPSSDFLEVQHNADDGNPYIPLCTTCGEEQDAPVLMEGDGTGVWIWTVVTSMSEPSHDIAMHRATP